jgi:hypothetical protein
VVERGKHVQLQFGEPAIDRANTISELVFPCRTTIVIRTEVIHPWKAPVFHLESRAARARAHTHTRTDLVECEHCENTPKSELIAEAPVDCERRK